jgi:hypothetical protein
MNESSAALQINTLKALGERKKQIKARRRMGRGRFHDFILPHGARRRNKTRLTFGRCDAATRGHD